MSDYRIGVSVSRVDYAKKRKGEYTTKTVFTDLEEKELEGLAAVESIGAIIGMFDVLAATDFKTDDANSLRDFAKLGAAIADNAYSNLCECLTGYAELMEERDELSR